MQKNKEETSKHSSDHDVKTSHRKKARACISPYFKVKKNSERRKTCAPQEMVSHFFQPDVEQPMTPPPGSRGLHRCVDYSPPKSPHGLIQERLHDHPWQLLVATIFLHKTSSRVALPLFEKFIQKYDAPCKVLSADWREIADLLQPMGLHKKRAQIIIRFSGEYLNKDWLYPDELFGIGKYGRDSYRIFCLGEWKKVQPKDHKLNLYYDWITEQDRLGLLCHY